MGIDIGEIFEEEFGDLSGSSALKKQPSGRKGKVKDLGGQEVDSGKPLYDYGADVKRTLSEFKKAKGKVQTGVGELTEFDLLLDDVLGRHSKRLNSIMELMDDEDFYKTIKELLPYARQKLKPKEQVSHVEPKPLKVIINR